MKIETKYINSTKNKNQEEVKVGFIHDTIKNSFLLEAIQDEMKKEKGISQILSSKRIDDDRELVRFLADAAKQDAVLGGYLRQAIDFTKSDKNEMAGIYAADSITILVAAHYSFTCEDLSNINIKGANIRNGIFSGADFTGADLSYTNLANIQADGAKFVKANLKAVKLGILPDLQGHIGYVNSVSFSSDGKYVASGSEDNTVKIWEVQTTKCLATFQGHTRYVKSVSFSSDGKYVASGSWDKTVKIWEVQTTKCLATLQGHTGYVQSVSFSSDRKYVASGSHDKTVKIWEVQTTKCLATLQDHTSNVNSVSFSSDGKYVASGSGDYTLKIWEVKTTKCLATLEGHSLSVESVSFSSDGKCIASGSNDNTVKIWEVQTTKCLATLQGYTQGVKSVSFSSDGKYVASCSSDFTMKIWEVQTTKCLATLQGHTGCVNSVSFSSDEKYVASGSDDNTVKIWEVQTTKCLATFQGHTDYVKSVSFSSDGKYVASGSWDETVKIWEVQTTKCLATLQGDTGYVLSVSFSSDGKYVASGSNDSTVKIWEVQTTKCLATLQGHTGCVNSVSFYSDGKYVASGSEDNTVKIWRKINHNWFCDKIFSASESFLTARNIIVKETVISAQNQELFKQRVEEKIQEAIIDDNNSVDDSDSKEIQENMMDDSESEEVKENVRENIIDDTQGELLHSFTFARETAKLSELILKYQIRRYEVLEKQKFVQLDLSTMLLPKLDLYQYNNNASAQENVKQIAVDQPNSNLSAEHSVIPRIKSDYNSKAKISSLNDINLNENEQQQLKQSKQLGSQKEGKMKSMKGVANSSKAKSACCNLFMVIGQKYDNPLLNYPQVFMEISRSLRMEKALQASDSLNKEGHSSLLDEVLQEISQEKDTRNYQRGLDLLRDLLRDVTGNQKKQTYIYISKNSEITRDSWQIKTGLKTTRFQQRVYYH